MLAQIYAAAAAHSLALLHWLRFLLKAKLLHFTVSVLCKQIPYDVTSDKLTVAPFALDC